MSGLLVGKPLHSWRVSYLEAVAIQDRLRSRLRSEPLPSRPRLVAGADVAYARRTHRVYAAVVVLAVPSLEIVETVTVARRATFPYIPGLLSFREAPPLLAAFERLTRAPDLVVFDGQGLAHPRRFGLACHVGLLLDIPSIGCAKTRLVGTHRRVGIHRGASAALMFEGERIGAVVRTREGVSPVFVSPGHRADVASATRLVLSLAPRYRLPEPQRQAHQATVRRYQRDRDLEGPAVRTYRNFVPRR